ncbi:hypothetical protein GCM10028801_31100 [Nocardioides maradonensis]
MSQITDLTAWQALADDDRTALMTALMTAARSDEDAHVVSDAVLYAASLLGAAQSPVHAARAALRIARAEHAQRVARSIARGTDALPYGVTPADAEDITGEGMGRLTSGGTDPADAYGYRVADVAVAVVNTLPLTARRSASDWLTAERMGRRGKRTTPAKHVTTTEHDALQVALADMGDSAPLAPAHPKHGRLSHGGHQTTTEHPAHVGRVTVRTPDGQVTTRDMSEAERAFYDRVTTREQTATYAGEGQDVTDTDPRRTVKGHVADGSQRSASDFHAPGQAARMRDGQVTSGKVAPSPRKRPGDNGPTITVSAR